MSGKCLKCGACCVSVGIWLFTLPMLAIAEDVLAWHLAHGATILFSYKNRMVGAEYRNACKYLTEDRLCGIFENRPAVCRGADEATEKNLDLRGCRRGAVERHKDLDSLKERICVGQQ